MKFFSYLHNSVLWSLALTSIVYSTLVLQMMMNTGLIFYGCIVLFFVLFVIFRRKRPFPISTSTTIVSMISLFLIMIVFLGLSSMPVASAAFISEGLGLRHASFGVINAILIIFIFGGFAAIAWNEKKHPRPKKELDPDEAKLERTGHITSWASFIVLAVVISFCAIHPGVRAWMGDIFALLASGDVNAVAAHIRSYGPWAAAVSACLMVLQSMAAPIPAFLITLANATVFGWWQGAILSWSSAMIGAAVCFYIARLLGRDAVAHFVSGTALATVDKFFERYGKNAILICRLLPFMSFDYVSYAAGLTGMGFWGFFVATGIGQLPATIVYSYVGGMLTGGAQMLMLALLMLFALFALIYLIRLVYKQRNKGMIEDEAATASAE